jgi:hypothetical protein
MKLKALCVDENEDRVLAATNNTKHSSPSAHAAADRTVLCSYPDRAFPFPTPFGFHLLGAIKCR